MRDPNTGKFVKAEQTSEGTIATFETDEHLDAGPMSVGREPFEMRAPREYGVGADLNANEPALLTPEDAPLTFIPRAAYMGMPRITPGERAKRNKRAKVQKASRRTNRGAK